MRWRGGLSKIKPDRRIGIFYNTPMDQLTRTEAEMASYKFLEHLGFNLAYLFHRTKTSFEVMLANGNTGVLGCYITSLFLQSKNIKVPQTIQLPIQRFVSQEARHWYDQNIEEGSKNSIQAFHTKKRPDIFYDNSSLLPLVREQYSHLRDLKEVLVVDDEIFTSLTTRMALELLQHAGVFSSDYIHATILAENHGFRWPSPYSTYFVTFLPLGINRKMNNVLSYSVDQQIENLFLKHLPEDFQRKNIANFLLDLPIKTFVNDVPGFTQEYGIMIKQAVHNFADLKKNYIELLLTHINTGWESFQ